MSTDIPIARVGISLPCQVPVVPGSPQTDAPIEQRTETCSTDAWWVFGRASICHLHLAEAVGAEARDLLAEDMGEGIPNEWERLPWHEQHRYEQNPDALFDGHPVKEAQR